MNGVSFQAKSSNEKLSPVARVPYRGRASRTYSYRPTPVGPFVSSTYASVRTTCNPRCPFKRRGSRSGGCFADSGFTRVLTRRLDEEARTMTSLEVAEAEAKLVDAAFVRGVPRDGARGGRDLRWHVGGDARGLFEADVIGRCSTRWRARGGGSVWTYTHSWDLAPRGAWGPDVSVLASVESPAEALRASEAGYVPAAVVPSFPSGPKPFAYGRFLAVPCPAETRRPGQRPVTCAECRLCLDREPWLRSSGRAIAFAAHGNDAARVVSALTQRSLDL